MTNLVSPSLIQSVVVELMGILGAKECARITGKSESVIYKSRDPHSGYCIPHDDLLMLDAAVARMRGDDSDLPYLSWAKRRVRRLAALDTTSRQSVDVAGAALEIGAAAGGVLERVRRVSSSGVMSANARIELQQSIAALSGAVARLDGTVSEGGVG